MRYNPDAAEQMLQPGQYAAVVKNATDKVSKSGNDMIELIVTVYGTNGTQVDVFDYLLSTDQWQWKVRHFCESAGIDYAKGELTSDECVDQNVKVNVAIDKGKDGYADKNKIADYLPRATEVAVSAAPVKDDDIPF